MEAGDLLDAVRAEGLLAAGQPVLVLLSGGRDSVCLFDLATRIAGREAVLALHVNYGLRDAADGDESHCRELCRSCGVELSVRRPGPAPSGNLHAWARAERYGAAAALAGDERLIAAGHTATDQVETILYRLASSPSRRALLGMRPREGRLVRPLLGFTREETGEYCRARGLAWREDESNDAPAYARARVRNRLVPALREIHPGAERNVAAVADILRQEAAVLDELVDEVLGGETGVELVRLRAVPPALARLVVQRLADRAAGGPAAGTARRTEEILALPDHGRAELHVGAGLRAVADRGRLHFARLETSAADAPTAPSGGRT